jgi:glyoxylate/hydroxypyruvate reductase A
MSALRITFCCTDTEPQPWLSGLREALPDADVSLWEEAAGQADYGIVWAPPQQFFDEQTALRAIFNIGAGVDALLQLRLPAGVPIVRLDDAGMSVQMAEYVCHALLRFFRSFDGYESDMRARKWSFRRPRSHADFPVGILGLGVLGERVARTVAQFDFPVNGWSRTLRAVPGIACFSGAEQLDQFLAASRVLACLLPLTEQTRDILNRRNLSLLRRGGFVINVARGAHLVDDDLIALLDSGHLAGAALDVFRVEPLPQRHPFWSHPKIVLTPHTSARTLREESIDQIVGKIAALQRGETVAGCVDPVRGY